MGLELSESFVKVLDIKNIKPSQMKKVHVDNEDICLANVDGKFYAIGNVCTNDGSLGNSRCPALFGIGAHGEL
jgi:nitrite reductase/ring-hydroxylating ferredoxin subunit